MSEPDDSSASSTGKGLSGREGDMDKQRTRIGVIYPEDGVLDDEFWRAVPPDVTVHVTRTRSNLKLAPGATYAEGHDRIAEGPYIDEAAGTFTLIKPAAVAYACTSV